MTQMTQPGYQEGSEPMWWWKVARHLDEAQLALTNAMAHNLDDPRPVLALHDRLREGQAILLEIFRMKGLLPGATNGTAAVPVSEMPMPVPGTGVSVPTAVAGGATNGEHRPPLVAEEPAVPEADQAAAAAEPEQPAAVASPEAAGVAPAAITSEAPTAPRAGAGG